MKRKVTLLAFLALVTAAWSLAQQQAFSNAPTDKDYRMRIREPQQGATITGTDVTIVLGEPFVPSGAGVNEREQRAMLTPTFQIWIDGKDFGNVPNGNNVFTARDLSYGPHKIVVVAKNVTGEVVDRKEIGITTVAAASATGTSTVNPPSPPRAEPPQPAPVPPQPATAPPQPEPAPAPSTLPQTASSYPDLAAAGLCLLAAGIVLRRRV